uniref:Uncharacterized protein n=1 Tax=Anguilla anguilla TaxID=7936 RepID=A0A0E9R126_ANGAN
MSSYRETWGQVSSPYRDTWRQGYFIPATTPPQLWDTTLWSA